METATKEPVALRTGKWLRSNGLSAHGGHKFRPAAIGADQLANQIVVEAGFERLADIGIGFGAGGDWLRFSCVEP
jgi:hypothetical protein